MSFVDNIPESTEQLYSTSYRAILTRIPATQYFCSGFSLPSLTAGAGLQPNLHTTIAQPGDYLELEPFSIEFLVNEDLTNWNEIFEWMKLIGMPIDKLPEGLTESNLVSDIEIIITKNDLTPNKRIIFRDAFPAYLQGLNFTSTSVDAEPLKAISSFHYSTFTIEDLNNTLPDSCTV